MAEYVRTVQVVYDDDSKALDGQDINKGFGGMTLSELYSASWLT